MKDNLLQQEKCWLKTMSYICRNSGSCVIGCSSRGWQSRAVYKKHILGWGSMLFDLYLTYIHYIVCSRLLDSKTVLLLVRKQNTSMIKEKFYCKPRVCVIIRVKWKVVFNIQTVLFEGGFCIGIHSFNSNTGNHRFLLKEQTKACTLVYTNTTTTSFVFDWFDVNL